MLEFLYDAIQSRGSEYIFEKLDRDDIVKLKNSKAIRKYIEKEKFEDILILLSKLNYGINITVYDKEKIKGRKVQDVMASYMGLDDLATTKMIVKEKLFSVMDFDIINTMITASRASNSKVYSVNQKFTEISNICGKMSNRALQEKTNADSAVDWLCNLFVNTIDLIDTIDALKITKLEAKMIASLYQNKAGITVDTLRDMLNISGVLKVAMNMEKKGLVYIKKPEKHTVYLSTMGVLLIEKIINKITA